MCVKSYSESGQPCGFEPCAEYKRLDDVYCRVLDNSTTLQDERDELLAEVEALRQELESSQQDHLDTIIERDELRQERDRLATALQKAVDDYGKPGGPWNIPSEPGTWLQMAKDALGGE